MVVGFINNGSGSTTSHAQTGDGVPVVSVLTMLGGGSVGFTAPCVSIVTMQNISSVSQRFAMITNGARERSIAIILTAQDISGGGGGGSGSGAGGWVQPLAASAISLLSKDWVGAWSRGQV